MTNIHIPSQLGQLSKKELLEYATTIHEENVILAQTVKSLGKQIAERGKDILYLLEQESTCETWKDEQGIKELRSKYNFNWWG